MSKKPDIPPHYYIQNMANELEKKGRKILHMEIGEPDLDTHPDIIREMYNKALEGYTHYGSVRGIPELREALADYINDKLGLQYTINNILAIPGSKISIFLLSYTFLRGDRKKVVLLTPTWGVYIYLVRDMGLDLALHKLVLENKWMLTNQDIEKLKETDMDAIVVINPSNPTGAILPKENIKAITDIAREKDAYIFADEIYFDLIYSGDEFRSFLQEGYEKAVGIYSFSKAYAMTGFRLGWIVASEDIITTVSKKMQLMFTNIPTFIQYAGLKAMEMKEIIEENREIYAKRTYLLSDGLEKLGFKFTRPKAGFYIFSKIPEGFEDGFDFAYKLLFEEGVTVAPGTAFGDYRDFIRFCSGVSEEVIEEALARIERFLEKKGAL